MPLLGARTFDVTAAARREAREPKPEREREREREAENPATRGNPHEAPESHLMEKDEVRDGAFAMPRTSPAYPRGPYRFISRECLIIAYRTDPEALARLVPKPLIAPEPIVKYEFIRMPDSTGLGDYAQSGQVIPVRLGDPHGGYVVAAIMAPGASSGSSP